MLKKKSGKVGSMKSTLIKSTTIDSVAVEIRISNEEEKDKNFISKFLFELLNFDND
jgi:hypothetical protein